MSGVVGPMFAAPRGSTGNNTHTSVALSPAASKTCVLFVGEAIGATPTVTYKIQGTLDVSDVTDANANWFDLSVVTGGSDTATAAPAAVTAVGATPNYLSLAHTRFVRRIRVVTSANTNVTYRAEVHQQYTN